MLGITLDVGIIVNDYQLRIKHEYSIPNSFDYNPSMSLDGKVGNMMITLEASKIGGLGVFLKVDQRLLDRE
jgi:hypothetical protein